MGVITFQTIVTEDQVIRPPIEIVLPKGTIEVTVKQVEATGTYGSLRRLTGCIDSGVPDAGLRHDDYIGEALEAELRGKTDG